MCYFPYVGKQLDMETIFLIRCRNIGIGRLLQQESAHGTFCHVTVQCFLNSFNFKYLFSSKLSTKNFKQLSISKHHCTLSVAVSILGSRLLVTNGRTTLLSNENNLSKYNTITIGYNLIWQLYPIQMTE